MFTVDYETTFRSEGVGWRRGKGEFDLWYSLMSQSLFWTQGRRVSRSPNRKQKMLIKHSLDYLLSYPLLIGCDKIFFILMGKKGIVELRIDEELSIKGLWGLIDVGGRKCPQWRYLMGGKCNTLPRNLVTCRILHWCTPKAEYHASESKLCFRIIALLANKIFVPK